MYDALLLIFLVVFPIFLHTVYVDLYDYKFDDIALQTLATLLVIIALIFLGRAIECGLAGPVTAIENSKTMV